MPNQQAGESSQAQPPVNKMPWEAGFWGEVGNTISQVAEGLTGASKAPPEPVKKALAPWERGFWDNVPKKRLMEPEQVNVKTEAQMKVAVQLSPSEKAASMRYETSDRNIADLKAEIARTKNSEAKTVLETELQNLLRQRGGR